MVQSARVLIVGSGVGAWVSAAFLRQSAHHVVLHQRSPLPEESGAFIAENGVRVLSSLGNPRLLQAGVAIQSISVFDKGGSSLSGHQYSTFPESCPVGINRTSLCTALSQLATGVTVRTGEISIESGSGSPVATDSLGKTEYDLIVLADGAESTLSSSVSKHAKPSGFQSIRFVTSTRDEQSVFVRIMGDGATLVHYPIGANRRQVTIVTSEQSISPDLSNLKSKIGPAGTALFENLNPASIRTTPRLQGLAERFSNQQVVLVGSAAHPLHSALGQSSSMNIEDARALQIALDESSSVNDALSLFEKMRRERVSSVYRATWDQADAGKKGGFATAFRGLLHKVIPATAPERQLESTLVDGDNIRSLVTHTPASLALSDDARHVLRFLVKIGQVDGRFDETERAFAKSCMQEAGHHATDEDLKNLEVETRLTSAGEIVRPFANRPQAFRDQLLQMGILLAASSGRVTSDEHKALRDAASELSISREDLENRVRAVIAAKPD